MPYSYLFTKYRTFRLTGAIPAELPPNTWVIAPSENPDPINGPIVRTSFLSGIELSWGNHWSMAIHRRRYRTPEGEYNFNSAIGRSEV